MMIRKMKQEDIPPLAELNARIFEDTSKEQAAKVFSASFRSGVEEACLVAEEGGNIIGSIIAERKLTFSRNTAGIKSFFVVEEHQKKGVGKALLDKCLSALKDAGIESVSLSVEPGNEAAISLYEKSGFKLFRLKYMKKI